MMTDYKVETCSLAYNKNSCAWRILFELFSIFLAHRDVFNQDFIDYIFLFEILIFHDMCKAFIVFRAVTL